MNNTLPTTLAQLEQYVDAATGYYYNQLVPPYVNAYFTTPNQNFLCGNDLLMQYLALDVLNNYLNYLPFPQALCLLSKLQGWQTPVPITTVTAIVPTVVPVTPTVVSNVYTWTFGIGQFPTSQFSININSNSYFWSASGSIASYVAWLNTLGFGTFSWSSPGGLSWVLTVTDVVNVYGQVFLGAFPIAYTISGGYPTVFNQAMIFQTIYPIHKVCYSITDIVNALNALGFGNVFSANNNNVDINGNVFLYIDDTYFSPYY